MEQPATRRSAEIRSVALIFANANATARIVFDSKARVLAIVPVRPGDHCEVIATTPACSTEISFSGLLARDFSSAACLPDSQRVGWFPLPVLSILLWGSRASNFD